MILYSYTPEYMQPRNYFFLISLSLIVSSPTKIPYPKNQPHPSPCVQRTHLAPIRLRLPPPPNLGRKQPQPLLVRPTQDDPRRLRGRHRDIRRNINVYRMRVAEFHV
jgi:hypothetical protein